MAITAHMMSCRQQNANEWSVWPITSALSKQACSRVHIKPHGTNQLGQTTQKRIAGSDMY
jgi:hypothetical protein